MSPKMTCRQSAEKALDEHIKNIFDLLMDSEDDELYNALQEYGDGVAYVPDVSFGLFETALAERFRQVARICNDVTSADISRVTGEALLKWRLPNYKATGYDDCYYKNFFLIEIVRKRNGKWEIRNAEFIIYDTSFREQNIPLSGSKLAIVIDAGVIAAAYHLTRYEDECQIRPFN